MTAATGVDSRPNSDVTIAITRDPALVRTVRLVAAAVARRADCQDALIEEVRLAVGEACAVMIGLEQGIDGSGEQVEVRIHTDGVLIVTVVGRVDTALGSTPGFAELGLDPWALLRGIAEDLVVADDGDRTTVQMSWPL